MGSLGRERQPTAGGTRREEQRRVQVLVKVYEPASEAKRLARRGVVVVPVVVFGVG